MVNTRHAGFPAQNPAYGQTGSLTSRQYELATSQFNLSTDVYPYSSPGPNTIQIADPNVQSPIMGGGGTIAAGGNGTTTTGTPGTGSCSVCTTVMDYWWVIALIVIVLFLAGVLSL